MTSPESWKNLVSDLDTIISQGAKSISVDRESWQKSVDALDRLVDEIKSETNIPDFVVRDTVRMFHKLFSFGKGTVDYWAFKHMCLFAMCHIYQQYKTRPEELLTLLQKEQPLRGSEEAESFLTECLISSIDDPKREVRDAVAQNFGALVDVVGDDLIEVILPSILDKFKGSTKEGFEGLMMTCGYLASYCSDISESHWNTLTELLVVESTNTQFGEYSRYVRMNAIKGLIRVMRSSTASTFSTHNNIKLIKKTLHASLKDNDIDVRRSAGVLFEAYYTFMMRLEHDSLVDEILDFCTNTLKEEGENRWEVRHGIACALENVAQSPKLIEDLNLDAVKRYLLCLRDMIRREDKDKSSFSANAVAGTGLTYLLVTLVRYHSDEQLVAQLFEEYAKPDLVFMLKSAHPQLLDASARCIDILITHTTKFVTSHMEEFMSLLFKNRFHAAYPIRSAANIIWEKSHKAIFREMFPSYIDLVSHLTSKLLDSLLDASKHENYEVRETVYQALSEVLKVTTSAVPSQPSNVERLFSNLLEAAEDMSGGPNSDYPRSAAIRALASLLQYSATHSVDISAHVKAIETLIAEKLSEIDETIIVKATLKVVEVASVLWRKTFESTLPIFAAKSFKISHMAYEDEIKHPAVPAYLNAFGQSLPDALKSTLFLEKFISSMIEELDEEKDELEREAVARMLRDISVVDYSSVSLTFELVKAISAIVSQCILNEENKESVLIKNSGILLLDAFAQNKDFQTNFSKVENAPTVYKALLATLRNEDEFDVESDFSPLQVEDSKEITQFEVSMRAAVHLLASPFDGNDLMKGVVEKTLSQYLSQSNVYSTIFEANGMAAACKAVGVSLSHTPKPSEKITISSFDELKEKASSPELEEHGFIQQWDPEDEEEDEKRIFLAQDPNGFRFGTQLHSGIYYHANSIIDAAVSYVSALEGESKVQFFKHFTQEISQQQEGEVLKNLLYILFFILESHRSNLKDIPLDDLLEVLESKLEVDTFVWLAYGSLFSIVRPSTTGFLRKISSVDWRVSLSQKCGEGVLAFVAITACYFAFSFQEKSDVEKSLQVLSDVLNDVNIIENKEWIKVGVEKMVSQIGPQIIPDPTPASDKSNSTFVQMK